MEVDSAAIARELSVYEQTIERLQFHYESFYQTEEHWLQNVEYSREVLSEAISDLTTCNNLLESDAQSLFAKCIEQCNAVRDARGEKTEHASSLKHILEELRSGEANCAKVISNPDESRQVVCSMFSFDDIMSSGSSADRVPFEFPAPSTQMPATEDTNTKSTGSADDSSVDEGAGGGEEDPIANYLHALDEII